MYLLSLHTLGILVEPPVVPWMSDDTRRRGQKMTKLAISLPESIAKQMRDFANQDRRSVSSAFTLAAESLLKEMQASGRYQPEEEDDSDD